MPELLAPAGNFEKLKTALLYGADAVYLAGKTFGMRSAAANFTIEELYEAVRYTHDCGKKVYLTVNVTPHTDEYDALADYFRAISSSGVDALIVADVGVASLAKEMLPHIPLHVSTQAGCVSHADCLFWYNFGATRVVLARELSFDEIRKIREKIPADLELEAFVHGSMCVSFSGRCLLSQYMVGRDANRGECAQPCRWDYKIYEIAEVKRDGMRMELSEDERGSYIMASRDMCMIEHIPDLMQSGIASFKIEGRMKSAYYAAVTSNCYRMAIDAYEKDPEGYTFDPQLLTELESVNHREYCTGYFYDHPMKNPQLVTRGGYLAEKAYLAYAVSYDEENKRATFVQRNKFSVGDKIELLSPGKVGTPFVCEALYTPEGDAIESVPHPYMTFTMPTPLPVKAGDILRMG